MKLSIVVLTPGPSEGKVIPVSIAQFVIGRDPQCQLRPASALISNRHCVLQQQQGKVFVRDLGSTNGTFVNDRQLRGQLELLDGDRLRVGPLLFAVLLESTPPVNRPTPLPPTKATTQLATPAPRPESTEEDAAAMLLSMQDNSGPVPGATIEEVPEGNTALELPAIPAAAPEKEKTKERGDTSSAAKTILEQYLKRPRNT
jgi:pSer/pThr/pTyr-binding forkhead associated (FHA) protein